MPSLLVWTGGLAGMLVFVVFTVAALGAIAAHRAWDWAAVFGAVALSGGGSAYAAHRRIERERRRCDEERLRAAAAWSGSELTVKLRWRKWLWMSGLAIALLALGGTMTLSTKPGPAVGGALLVLVLAIGLAAMVLQAGAAVRAGYLLRLDASGVHHCSGVSVPWRDVLAVHLKQVTMRNQVNDLLVLVLRPHVNPEALGGGMLHRLVGPRHAGNQLAIPLGIAAADPERIAHAATAIGGRAGVAGAWPDAFSWAGVAA